MLNAKENQNPLSDVQQEIDSRNIPLQKVGVKDLRYPIVVFDKAHRQQHTIANINMYVNLPHQFRGIHMSRFLEALNECKGQIHVENIRDVLRKIRSRLEAEEAHMEVEFSYFIEKEAPVSKSKSMMEYQSKFVASSDSCDDFILIVVVPVTTLCPCSKSLSKRSAHNQRSMVTVQVRFKDCANYLWIEELIDIVEQSASAPVYSLLKREDEQFVTGQAYKNPRFVEDLVREVALKLEHDERVIWYAVEAENQESIHNHSAYAYVEKRKKESGM